MGDRLFDVEQMIEVPILRPPRRSRGDNDARFRNDYPPSWKRCTCCHGAGCPDCLGMGSLRARVRLQAGHRCERCLHPYIPKADAAMLRIEPTPFQWSPCDDRCAHKGPIRERRNDDQEWFTWVGASVQNDAATYVERGFQVEAEWRILTVHHLDGDKANCEWWNLAALCQRCHLEIQAKVIMERVYPHEHTEWFKPHAAGYYAHVYLGQSVTREEAIDRIDELLALELNPRTGGHP